MSNYTFSQMPSVSISRTKFDRTQPHGTSFNLGEIVVLGFDEVIPGSTHKLDIGSLIRMSQPIAPIMDDIQYDIYSFFVPMRLTWKHWKNFSGESENAGVANSTYTIPSTTLYQSFINTLADDLGLPPVAGANGTPVTGVSTLPFRGFGLIYNRFFRNQNVESPLNCDVDVDNGFSTNSDMLELAGIDDGMGNSTATANRHRLVAYKLPDYFTSALPYAQKGDPVRIPMSGVLPVSADYQGLHQIVNVNGGSASGTQGTYQFSNSSSALTSVNNAFLNSGRLYYDNASYSGSGSYRAVNYSNLVVDLAANKMNSTINDLRFAFQLQKALEKDAMYGSRYWEVLRAHYAVTAPDASLQDPELLGHIKFDINISQVVQTTGFVSASNTSLGTPGANSVTAHRGHVFTASFVEHGYLYTVGVARQKRHTYSQGINRLWRRSSRFDFYYPVFANIGAQRVENSELYAVGSSYNGTFGYQEAWAEYRYLPGYNSGLLNPARANSLDYWNLAENFASVPYLTPSFLKEDRTNLTRCLVTGTTGPDFIANFYIKDTVVNPMPLYSIPGFADHH